MWVYHSETVTFLHRLFRFEVSVFLILKEPQTNSTSFNGIGQFLLSKFIRFDEFSIIPCVSLTLSSYFAIIIYRNWYLRFWFCHIMQIMWYFLYVHSDQTKSVHLLTMDISIFDCIYPCCVNTWVSEDVGESYDVFLYSIEGSGEQMPKIMRKYLFRWYSCRFA